jgi:hypothetical protein
MWRNLLPVLLLAGCAQLPPGAEDIQAHKFESVPGKSVIYVVRPVIGSGEGQTLTLDGRELITTYRGTYYRWEVDAGPHRVAGFASGSESVTLTTAPGQIYFLEHTVVGDPEDGGVLLAWLREVNDQTGRSMVARARLLR